MAKQIDLQSVLDGRVNTYRMLSRLYKREVDADYLAHLKKMRCPINTGNAEVDEGYRLFHRYLCAAWERTLEDLERDYMRVFIGANTTGYAAAYPNESVHTSPDRLMMQDARDEVLALYKAAGLKSDPAWTGGDDHIALELEYMQVLSGRAAKAQRAGDEKAAASSLMAQRNFVVDHLQPWVPFLVEDMLKFARTDFYRALAHLTQGFIEEDLAFLEAVLADELKAEDEGQGVPEGPTDGPAGEAEC